MTRGKILRFVKKKKKTLKSPAGPLLGFRRAVGADKAGVLSVLASELIIWAVGRPAARFSVNHPPVLQSR